MRPLAISTLIVLVAALVACGGDDGPPVGGDAGGGTDAGEPPDGGPPTDAGVGVDAGGGDDAGPASMPCMAPGDCDPFDPSSCPMGQACRRGMMGTECLPVEATTLGPGEVCDRNAQCQPGTFCLNFGDGFSCQRVCPAGSLGFCGDAMACIGSIGDPCIQVCRPIPIPCDIYAQDCADPMMACTLARHPETNTPYTGCRTPGMQGLGDPCGGDMGNCQRGAICVREMGMTQCAQVCGPDGMAPTCTQPGQRCDGFARTWMVPYCR